MSMADKFKEAMTRTNAPRIVPAPPKPPPDPEQQTAYDLHDWAESDAALDTFMPWLCKQIAQIDVEKAQCIERHALMAYHQGRLDFARFLRDKFQQWSGVRRKDSAQAGEQDDGG
jgi:hypothetical protein